MSAVSPFTRFKGFAERLDAIAAQIRDADHLERLLRKLPARERPAFRRALLTRIATQPLKDHGEQ